MTTARFISPFMANGNIVEYLENASQPVSDDLRLELLRDSLEGLLYLHSLSPPICHADIKPENVLVTDMVEAVLCDFGLARLTEGQPSGLTTTKTIKGSTRYMSPELLEEDAVHTLSSDIWAYGCLVLKVMTGSLPYARARSEHQVLLALMKPQQPADPSGLGLRDDGLKTLLAKCWNKSPSTRPSASECQLYLPSPISSLMCAGCDLRIVGEVVSVKARRWHPACFKCSGCGELLKHDSFYEHEGKPYCHLDYHEFVALRCYHCETPIANERFITVNDPGLDGGATRYYHELHFFCSECGDPFPHPSASSTAPKGENPHEVHHNDLGYILYRGHAYCEPCHEKLRMPKCAGCKKGVRVGDEDVRALGRSWHFYCFVCTSCKRPFEDEYPLPRGEDAYCDHCYSILVKSEL
ncbi:hypothetical protein M407DRAFT_103643 [Tulasnella calospora MUT 4182]|uniref:Protein kinase domain-containing protein n=1 Tax=Tulasnella calospora MUT 4182 TaxID=1051891 RepID=A0A0C3QEA7_9AGAM|nr:hypothetical protein M407DRAFT_103643 [Tulasnella calospora MUT 4182]